MRVYSTEQEKAWALINDSEYFAANCLKLPAWGMKGVRGIVPLLYTYLQRRVMQEVSWQIEHRNNEVDLEIVKPRKMRCTSVLNGWEYQRITFEEALTVLNIAHSAPVAEEIFDRHIKSFHKFMPEHLRRTSKTDNKRELSFEENLSKMIVAVAGSNSTRGPAASILHLTETGWYNAMQVRDVQAAVFPSVERGPGTARISESTSGGAGTWQHKRALAAKEGDGETRLLFIGCYEVPEYRIKPPKDWEPSPDEKALMKEFKLDLAQIYWRHVLLKEQYDGQEMLFNMEYPATFDLAFQMAGNRFFNPVKLMMAKHTVLPPCHHQPAIMGIDPAGRGDRTVFVIRQGRSQPYYEVHRNMDAPTVVGIAKRLKARFNTQNEFIDMGYGHGAYDLARSMGMYSMIGIYPGGKADRDDLYANKRTECAFRYKEWIEQGPETVDGVALHSGAVSIPKTQEFYDDLAAVPGEEIQPGTGKLILPSKEKIKKELGGKSPDIFDAGSYTFAFEVANEKVDWKADWESQAAKEKSMFDTDNAFSRFDTESTFFDNDATMFDSSLGLSVNWRGTDQDDKW